LSQGDLTLKKTAVRAIMPGEPHFLSHSKTIHHYVLCELSFTHHSNSAHWLHWFFNQVWNQFSFKPHLWCLHSLPGLYFGLFRFNFYNKKMRVSNTEQFVFMLIVVSWIFCCCMLLFVVVCCCMMLFVLFMNIFNVFGYNNNFRWRFISKIYKQKKSNCRI
jgi:hypothetical protein